MRIIQRRSLPLEVQYKGTRYKHNEELTRMFSDYPTKTNTPKECILVRVRPRLGENKSYLFTN